jgi:hypothetical protein
VGDYSFGGSYNVGGGSYGTGDYSAASGTSSYTNTGYTSPNDVSGVTNSDTGAGSSGWFGNAASNAQSTLGAIGAGLKSLTKPIAGSAAIGTAGAGIGNALGALLFPQSTAPTSSGLFASGWSQIFINLVFIIVAMFILFSALHSSPTTIVNLVTPTKGAAKAVETDAIAA